MTKERVLIVTPAWVGDMIMAQSLFKLIKQREPDRRIDIVGPQWVLPIGKRMPEVEQAFDLPLKHGELNLTKRYQIARSLSTHQYDWSIVLPNSFKSALVPFFAKINKRTGWLGEVRYGILNDSRKLDKSRYPLLIERFCALAMAKDAELPQQLPYPALSVDEANQKTLLEKFNVKAGPMIAFCPGAEYGPAKRWPATYFATLADKCALNGWQVCLFGSPNDKAMAAEIKENAQSPIIDFVGETSLTDAIDLMASCDAVVSNDSGLMHVAASIDKPLVAIYGSSSPNYTPPLSKQAEILETPIDCSPCFKRTCPNEHYSCLRQITPRLVLLQLQNIMEKQAA